MSATLGALDLRVRRTNWRAVTIALLSAVALGIGALVITQTVSHETGSVARKAPASVVQSRGMENPSVYAPVQEPALTRGMENPSVWAPFRDPALTRGMENPSVWAPLQEIQSRGMENPSVYAPPGAPRTCGFVKLRPC